MLRRVRGSDREGDGAAEFVAWEGVFSRGNLPLRCEAVDERVLILEVTGVVKTLTLLPGVDCTDVTEVGEEFTRAGDDIDVRGWEP